MLKKKKSVYSGLEGAVHGSVTFETDTSEGTDDRFFEKSAMKHSPYFERIRGLRNTADFYRQVGFFPERYSPEFPLHENGVEFGCETTLEVCERCRELIFSGGRRIVLYSDGSVYLAYFDDEMPELFFDTKSATQVHDAPYYDYIISQGGKGQISVKTAEVIDIEDSLTEKGGEFYMIFELFDGEKSYRRLCLELEVSILSDETPEIINDTIDYFHDC